MVHHSSSCCPDVVVLLQSQLIYCNTYTVYDSLQCLLSVCPFWMFCWSESFLYICGNKPYIPKTLTGQRTHLFPDFYLCLLSLKDWDYLLGSHYHHQMNSQPVCGPVDSSGSNNTLIMETGGLSSVSNSLWFSLFVLHIWWWVWCLNKTFMLRRCILLDADIITFMNVGFIAGLLY